MQAKNKPAPTKRERSHIERIKGMPCAVCDKLGPSECHEIKQGQWFSSIPLCKSCHRDGNNGLHGQGAMWRVMRMDEIDALAKTVGAMLG